MLDPHRIEHTSRNDLTRELLEKYSRNEATLDELEYIISGEEFVTDDSLKSGIQEVKQFLSATFPFRY